MLILVACSSGNESQIKGKWSLAGSMTADAPTSFWFKWGGSVVAPWEKHNIIMQSKGEYEFIDDTHIKINMQSGYYNGNSYYFEIVKLDEKKMVLKTNFQEIEMKRVED
ncbi:MAG TPA: hypothetical protein ENH18_02990 [Nitrospirae bacterium]|nr:hypothetical protein [Nitrospirota bacterium]HEW81315.1 hypothetical protein [Nitrospirota bacterium]